MATATQKTIDEIDDIIEMAETMKALGISSQGLKTLDQMKDRVRTILHQTANKPSWTARKAFAILSEAKDEHTRKRKFLLSLYNDAEQRVKVMDQSILSLLQSKVGNIEENIKKHKLQLAREEYFLLVAGETSSGKSSLINLIMGEELLPYSVLSTTSTICELKFGTERKIVAHFKDKDPNTGLPTKVIKLKENPNTTSEKQSYLQQISLFVHVKKERQKGSIYKKIELFWPHDLLQKGIVIIDSPGVGESDIMDEMVTEYLPRAFAFIYTINSPNAGGVQKDRLEKLLENVKKAFLEGKWQLPSKCALFVCNKWDQVPEKEDEEVKSHIVKKLKQSWPDLDPSTQITYMSTLNATTGQNLGIVTDEFSSLMEGIQSMVLKGIECRMEMHWRWLDFLLSRMIFQAKAFISNASKDRLVVFVKMTKILKRLVAIETRQNKVMEELTEYLSKRVSHALTQLSKYLSTEDVRKRFTSWTLDDTPKAEMSWEATENLIKKTLSRRLRDIIEQWEEDNEVFSTARESLLKHFQQRYNFVEEQLRNLQSDVIADNVGSLEASNKDGSLTVAQKVAVGVTSPIWIPLSLVALVIGAPVVGIMALTEKLQDKKKLKTYNEDRCAFMTKESAEYLDKVNNEIVLRKFVNEQLQEAKLCLEGIKARIPELIQADKMLCEQLGDETRGKKQLLDLYQPLLNVASVLRGNLAVFGFKEVFGEEISRKTLDWQEDESHRLGSGAFAVVYKGTMTRNGPIQPVALKVYNKELSAMNACEILAEVELLRKLNHPSIVKFHGSSLLRDDRETRVILVMEKCTESLKSRLYGKPEHCPGKSRNSEVFKGVCNWAIQITEALDYIHEQGIIHRDLKLDNILLSEDDRVRVTDVGVSKHAVDITGTLAGTVVYIAPEVFRSKIYEFSADIYSLGIMLWEIWYGQPAFTNIKFTSLAEFFNFIANEGCRPGHDNKCREPPHSWQELMMTCWKTDPTKRPNAKKCKEALTELYKTL
ncbi:dual serine/threonine and tyrosine protein kinase-like [Acropora muricata]|uniref:dual serine/threonine and tyrosine protein kinase-like n=1 Tax=Acropora muricata TaxID=159855 RepID=UPI0034E5166B